MKIRWFTIAPTPEGVPQSEMEKLVADAFQAIGADHDRPDVSKGSGMHLTSTIDVIVLIKGRVRLGLDEEETVLHEGDIVIQRGTHHAWICEGPHQALLVAVLIDKKFAM